MGVPKVIVSDDRKAIIEAALEKAAAAYGDPVCGTTRATFALPCGTKVLKIPYTLSGIYQNRDEATHKERQEKSNWVSRVPLAECRIVSEDHDIPILEMERVTPVPRFTDGLPKWTFAVDCAQVGYTADGRLVAYDL